MVSDVSWYVLVWFGLQLKKAVEGRTQAGLWRTRPDVSSIKAEGWLRESDVDVKPQHCRHVAQVSLWICSSLPRSRLGPTGDSCTVPSGCGSAEKPRSSIIETRLRKGSW